MKPQLIIITLPILFFLFGCNELTDYSPFDIEVNYNNLNSGNLEQIDQAGKENDTIKFIVFSDTHSYYDEFKDAVSSINKQKNISFAVCCGDITEKGLSKEYNWYHDICKQIKIPVITVIGNHDYLSNGFWIYSKMFGPPNFSFIYGQYKFIAFDDVVWENNNTAPRFDWLNREITSDTTQKCIILTHIPPWTDQLTGENASIFEKILSGNDHVMLCIHGHLHNHEMQYFASKPSLVSGSVYHRSYSIISLYGNNFLHEQVRF